MAQSGVLRVPRVQLIRGLARTKKTANLSADSQQSLPQVSSTAGRHPGGKLIPTRTEDHALAQSTRNAGQSRRLLTLAEIYDGGSRTKQKCEQPRAPGQSQAAFGWADVGTAACSRAPLRWRTLLRSEPASRGGRSGFRPRCGSPRWAPLLTRVFLP